MDIIKEQHITELTVEESLDKGLWRTGKNKYVEIKSITDPFYLQKIALTLYRRCAKIDEYYITVMETQGILLQLIAEQAKEIGVPIKFEDNPIGKICGNEDIERWREYLNNLIEVKGKH